MTPNNDYPGVDPKRPVTAETGEGNAGQLLGVQGMT
jgi:hypothetical protein